MILRGWLWELFDKTAHENKFLRAVDLRKPAFVAFVLAGVGLTAIAPGAAGDAIAGLLIVGFLDLLKCECLGDDFFGFGMTLNGHFILRRRCE